MNDQRLFPFPFTAPRIRPSPVALAWILWLGLVGVSAGVSILRPTAHTVYPIYSYAAGEWLAGRDIYVLVPDLDFFRYGPAVAVFFAPWRMLGDGWGGAIWRILGAALLAGGLATWARTFLTSRLAGHGLERSSVCRSGTRQSSDSPGSGSLGDSRFTKVKRALGLLFVLVWPLALQNINNGQSNAHLLGLILFGMSDAATGRYWRAGIAFAAAVLFKPYLLALVGLLILIDARLLRRFAISFAAGLALPFAFQSPEYVVTQYTEWVRHFAGNDRSWMELRACYRDLQLLCRVYGKPLHPWAFHLIEVLAGIGMAGLIVAGKRARWSRRELFTRAFALASCWMTVLGPATESCTYLLLGPAVAAAVLSRPGTAGRWVRIACGLLLGPVAAGLFPNDWRIHALGPQPAGGLIFLSVIVGECVVALRNPRSKTVDSTPLAA